MNASIAPGWSWSCAPDRTGFWASADPDSPARRSTEPDPRSHLRQVSAEVSAARELQHELVTLNACLSISLKNRQDCICAVLGRLLWKCNRLQITTLLKKAIETIT